MKAWMAGFFVLAVALSVPLSAFSMTEPRQVSPPPPQTAGCGPAGEPMILFSAGDTTWLQVHNSDTYCPGDPNWGHGGEATGGPRPLETWCFEQGPGDSCGENPPWDTNCFKHIDVRALPSETNINYWHIDTYRTSQRTYCGSYALWCGSGALWQGQPVECGTWRNPPGYGKQWNCHVQLTLPSIFNVANGCTLYFDPRYDTECKYDYFYVDYWNGTTWKTLATFNATSNDPGGVCGAPSKPNPDYWGNSTVNRLVNCNWQNRANSSEPAFKGIITHTMLGTVVNAPMFRWRFTSDGGWDDQDGDGDTDGGAFLDNVWVRGDAEQFTEDFESGVLNPAYWSLPDPPGILDAWHIRHDPDPPYEGGDGGSRLTCHLDSSFVYRGRPEQGYHKNSWFYRLMTPRVAIQNTGALVQYDAFFCVKDVTCDYDNEEVRFHDTRYGRWCPWIDPSPYIIYCCGCFFPLYDINEDVSHCYGASADSMQFSWELLDTSSPGDVCQSKHTGTEYQVDNVSIGFYDAKRTDFITRGVDILHDSFLPQVDQAFNSFFDAYDTDSVNWYKHSGHVLPKTDQLYLDVGDDDGIATVQLKASIDKGATWVTRPMTLHIPTDPLHRSLGGKYYGDVRAGDFGFGTSWPVGTEVWYYVLVTDSLSHLAYMPARANPGHPAHDGTVDDQWHFVILPEFPSTYDGVKILLVDGHNRRLYDYSPCLSTVAKAYMLEDMYENTLRDAGYCYDKYDIEGAGSNVEIHPIWFTDYDAVVWFTGPYFSNYLFWKEAQVALRSYMADGGKVVLCGDRIAFDMAPIGLGGNGDDSLGGEFLGGVMGTTYLREMETAFGSPPTGLPFVYAQPAQKVSVFGDSVAIDLDPVLVYRECPYLKDMSYIQTNPSPPAGYTAQPLLHMTNPIGVTHADEATYVEYQGAGQCVFVNFDLSAVVNHVDTYCDGNSVSPAPDFAAGTYAGRVDLMHLILHDLFDLPSNGGGTSGVARPPVSGYRWALSQNSPNPCVTTTSISFEMARSGVVAIKVYNAAGQMVRTLVNERQESGSHQVAWDGTNDSGAHVSSGVYFYKMEAGAFRATKKMLVIQ
jgi:FlgD Ig-like domain